MMMMMKLQSHVTVTRLLMLTHVVSLCQADADDVIARPYGQYKLRRLVTHYHSVVCVFVLYGMDDNAEIHPSVYRKSSAQKRCILKLRLISNTNRKPHAEVGPID